MKTKKQSEPPCSRIQETPPWTWADGTKVWRHQNILHRLDGPAVENPSGENLWYVNGTCYGESKEPPVEYILAALSYKGMKEIENENL